MGGGICRKRIGMHCKKELAICQMPKRKRERLVEKERDKIIKWTTLLNHRSVFCEKNPPGYNEMVFKKKNNRQTSEKSHGVSCPKKNEGEGLQFIKKKNMLTVVKKKEPEKMWVCECECVGEK